ncbi:MAG: hypothetical protein U1E06_00760 [Tabrizicola sp.]|uniref:hypothetical protein n=1 Tax=Tabrizicola sp. TaxID=2005166 RepID=UPI00273678D6|nr:hypothetical protein [Tabrizicola sp.]MDP3261546.1 hypothetical protein [Tabrizicola sp.]MDP3648385.1 hypothetical protein [Paracoccaceae bacterium]MDZ4065379.1 hypothetical protein [Tabrizicola sp.]
MSRHVADKRATPTGGRVQRFWHIARARREIWHRKQDEAGPSRLIQFLRIARGRTP